MPARDSVLRPMRVEDIPAVLDAQQPAAVVGLADVFPQDVYPFPRDAISGRWRAELADPSIACFVILKDEAVAGFAALHGGELMHFGVALEEWGSGLALAAHDEILDVLRESAVERPWLRVYAENPRGRAFWESLGWTDTGDRSRGPMPPHAELMTYELHLEIDRNPI